ncbi:putative DNA helicase [Paraburkholderia tropica]|uniref:UvrD-helicase domain-containing protein n=1 Tax=Paraburkholderia tropica TaxID=92647 RepID=UPI001CB5168B|nr:UvrD-helicase domain-containing protein [Paraburkholderia tropica]CAG9219993.1 putative DNA helicase [Paraburkholderia tropica]
MKYFAITQQTADWLLSKPTVVDELVKFMLNPTAMRCLAGYEFTQGPVRLSGTEDSSMIAFWNIDYLGGTGAEAWGFIRIDSSVGLSGKPEIAREVFERCLYVLNQRLRGYRIDGAFIHRSYANGTHTCLAGRGSTARQYSVGFIERNIDAASTGNRTFVCVGPMHDFSKLSESAEHEGAAINALYREVSDILISARRNPITDAGVLQDLSDALSVYTWADGNYRDEYADVEISASDRAFTGVDLVKSIGMSYEQWLEANSPLSNNQRRILNSIAIDSHPLRIVGPGGSGKTLLMQLLALKRLDIAKKRDISLRVLYIAHNSAMAEKVARRFDVLENGNKIRDAKRTVDIMTLTEYGLQQLGLEFSSIIDPDAEAAKEFQFNELDSAISQAFSDMENVVRNSTLLSEIQKTPNLMRPFVKLAMAEISSAIKGHGLENDKRRYVESEQQLSRLHGILNADERLFMFNVFERYRAAVFEGYQVLDTDDIALSLLGRLRTPIWELKRKDLGYDYVFVDEAQLFNENERRVFPFLTNGKAQHVPIVLALDEAQDIYGQSSAGFASLGIVDMTSENLSSIHRSTRDIVKLAFFVIQRSTDLFGSDFPDFTGIADKMEDEKHPLVSRPRVEIGSAESKLGKFVLRRIRDLRKANIRQIGVICHADQYWDDVLTALRGTDLPLQILEERGVRLPSTQPLVVLTKPAYVGGQEFDAVVAVGLEQGVVPPRVSNNDALATAIEQQTLRELYLSITRARFRLVFPLTTGASPSAVLQDAIEAGLLDNVA